MKRLLTAFVSTALLALPAAADHHSEMDYSEMDQRNMTSEARQISKDLIKQLGGALK